MKKLTIMRVFICLFVLLFFNCKKADEKYIWKSRTVTATAYNSVVSQTNSNPDVTAFGDNLKPGLKYIAVSRDLLKEGFKHNTPVKIEGLKGVYLVKDKMHSRWTNHIDIYMGTDVNAAKQWGKKKVRIDYGTPKE